MKCDVPFFDPGVDVLDSHDSTSKGYNNPRG